MQERKGVVRRREILRRGLGFGVLGWGAGAAALTGCSAGPVSRPVPTSLGSVSAAPVPNDGVSLEQLGFTYGPVRAWSLPATALLTDRVNQTNQVTMMITAPDPAAVVSYLIRALPPAGFTLENQQVAGADSAVIALGYGWRGSVVGVQDRTAVTLQQLS